MKKAILLFLLCAVIASAQIMQQAIVGVAAPALPAPSYVNSGTCDDTSSAGTCNVSLSVTSGGLILVCMGSGFALGTYSASDSVNSYSAAFSRYAGSNGSVQCLYAIAASTTTLTIACTQTGPPTFISCQARQYSGPAGSPLDKSAGAAIASSSTSWTTGTTSTTASANEILIGVFAANGNNGTCTAGGSFTHMVAAGGADMDLCIEDEQVSATGAYSASMTNGTATASGGGAVIVTFK